MGGDSLGQITAHLRQCRLFPHSFWIRSGHQTSSRPRFRAYYRITHKFSKNEYPNRIRQKIGRIGKVSGKRVRLFLKMHGSSSLRWFSQRSRLAIASDRIQSLTFNTTPTSSKSVLLPANMNPETEWTGLKRQHTLAEIERGKHESRNSRIK